MLSLAVEASAFLVPRAISATHRQCRHSTSIRYWLRYGALGYRYRLPYLSNRDRRRYW